MWLEKGRTRLYTLPRVFDRKYRAGRIVPLDTKMMKSLQETRGKARYNSSFWLVKVLDIHHFDYVIATNDISTNLLRSLCGIRLATPQVTS